MLKCAYCDSEFSPFFNVNGKTRNGYSNVSAHVRDDHPDKWEEIQKALRQFDFDSGLDDMNTVSTDL